MKTQTNTCSSYSLRDDTDFETRGVWEDAGFIPPPVYMHLTEYLHLAFSNEDKIPELCFKEIIDGINKSQLQDKELYVINDKKRMYCFAEGLGINVLNEDDALIAAEITECIITEYIPPGYADHPLRNVSSGKNEYAENCSSLKP